MITIAFVFYETYYFKLKSLYNKYLLPKITHFVCSTGPVSKQREKIIPLAYGKVLEIGIGSGLNLPFYEPEIVHSIVGIDPSTEMLGLTNKMHSETTVQVELITASADNLPLDNHQFDCIVSCFTLCSISKIQESFEEIRRVLKPKGKLIFCEHGKAPDGNIYNWQKRLNPIWNKLGGGCNLTRDIPAIIQNEGFKITTMQNMYIPHNSIPE